MREAVIVKGARSAIAKAQKGALRQTRPDDFGAMVLQGLLDRVPELEATRIEDIYVGCATPEAEQGANMARVIAMRAQLPTTVAGVTINRFCSSGLQTIAMASQAIVSGQSDVMIAGGVESMSRLPMGGYNLSPNPTLVSEFPEVYIQMGHTAERVAKRFSVSREDQDRFALRSHTLAAKAIDEGKVRAQIVGLDVTITDTDERGYPKTQKLRFEVDEGVRRSTSLEALASLKPAFSTTGSVTAGNASQTSDGAAFVVMMEKEQALALGLKPIAVLRSFAVGGVDPDVMGIGPVVAVPKALRQAGLSLQDIDLIELNEAFAAQAIAVMRELGMNEDRVNVNGGAIALGHPLGCTGARQTVDILEELQRQRKQFGMVTMCIGGGMGAAGIFEMLE